MLSGEGRERDLRDLSACGSDGLELAHQGMVGIDFVVTISADQQQVRRI